MSALCAVVFDAFTPRGVASGTLYILSVLLVPTVSTRGQLLGVACIASLLNGLGYLMSTPVDPWWMGPVNRAIATGLIWGVALLAWQRIMAVRREQQEHARWETTVGSMGDAVVVTDAAGAVTFLNYRRRAVRKRSATFFYEPGVHVKFLASLMPLAITLFCAE